MRIKQNILLLLILLAIWQSSAQIQSPYNFKYKFYTTQNGLSHNYVKKCTMDSKGFLWVLTLHGISKFDGLNFVSYKHEPNNKNSLPFNEASDLAIDNKDNIWLAFKTKLYKLDRKSNFFQEIKWKGKSLEIHKLVWDENTKNIIAVSYKGYYQIHFQTLNLQYQAFIKPEKRTSEYMGEILLDAKKRLWIPYWRWGYHCINLQTNAQYYHKQDFWPLSFTEDKKGDIFCNSWQNAYLKINVTDTLHQFQEFMYPRLHHYTNIIYHSAFANALTGDSIIWMSNSNQGIWLFNNNSKKYVQRIVVNPEITNGFPDNTINYFYEDKAHNFWLCTWHGLAKINSNEQQFKSRQLEILESRFYNLVSGMHDDVIDKNITWMSVHGSGIFKLNKKDNSVIAKYFNETSKTNNPDEDINYDRRWFYNMTQTSDGSLWCPTYGGFAKIKNCQVSFIDIRSQNRICYNNHIAEMNPKMMLATSDLGVLKFNPQNNFHEIIPYFKNGIVLENSSSVVVKINDSLAAVGTPKGLRLLYTNTNKWKDIIFDFANCDSNKINQITCLAYRNYNLYIGTYGGLVEYNFQNNKATLIGSKENIDAMAPNSMLMDKNDKLWVYTLHDLFCYDTKTKSINSYSQIDGIYNLTNDGNVLFEYNNKFYIGFRKAFTEFDPLSLNQSTQVNTPWIDKMVVNSKKEFQVSSQHKLHYTDNEIEFYYTSCDYTFSDKIQFQVMLQGYESTWKNVGTQRSVVYNNLAPGKYTFLVKSANSAGLWNERPVEYSFEIVPAFWQTWWFKMLILLLIFGAIYLFFKWRIKNSQRINEEKNKVQELSLSQYQKQLELEQITNYFSVALLQENEIDSILKNVSKNLMSKLSFEDCMIYLWNADKTILVQKAGYGIKGAIENRTEKEKYNIQKGQGIIGRAAMHNAPVIINDTSLDENYRIVDGINRLSEICVPIVIGDNQIGMINAEASTKNYFDAWHLQLLSTIATLIAEKINAVEAHINLQNKQLELAKASSQIAEAELSMLRSQMNPHFIFNSLHSIHNYIWENNLEDASEYLVKFAKLIRRILELSNEKLVSLQEEIDTLKLYIELEHRRIQKKFNYHIDFVNIIDLESIQVPPLIFQPFVENAIWHGLNHLSEANGELHITFLIENNFLVTTIDDNGIGRTQAATIKSENSIKKKSLGLEITKRRIQFVAPHILDAVYILDKPIGTQIKIKLPLQYE